MSPYEQVCIWIVTIAGSLVVLAFAVYFVVVIAQLVGQAVVQARGRPAPPETPLPLPTPSDANACGCGAPLGEVQGVMLVDGAAPQARRICTRCQRVHLVPYTPPP